ncbi:MAG TPA: DUF2911 domain-containing protein [Flavisolibacter sp.]|nr:DUF2911 domain-containing protein [Flavisolibacter sp.]
MKNAFLVLLLPLLFSCQNDSPVAQPTKPSLIKDTNLLKREAVNPYEPVDISPMDMVYFPADYPVLKMNGETKAPPVARVIYSRPHRQGRKIFGNIVKWGEPWRLGANEATELQLFRPVTIQNKRIEKGQYVLYAIPHENHWIIVFNSNLYTWGLKFDLSKDVAKFDIPATAKNQTIEYFTMVFEKTASGADLVMAWEGMEARLPIQF